MISRYKIVRMPIRLIKPISRGRFRVDQKRVAEYRRMLQDELKLLPIDVGPRLADGRWQLLCGRHRLMAAKLEGANTIEVGLSTT